MTKASDLPEWKDMPPIEGMPHGTAWGLFDKDGIRDEVGTLNLLTPSVVVAAGKEIQTGKSVVLNWGLEHVAEPGFGRIRLEHKIIDWRKIQDYYSYDDEIKLNPQAGSQWDGLRHFGHTETGLYYNNIHHDDLLQTDRIGIDHWSKRGGIVGRGVLLDYCSWAERHGIEYNAMSRHCITVKDLEAVAKEQGVTFMPGDLLIVRSGWIKWYNEHGQEDRIKYITNGKEYVGVEGSEETVEWLWNHHFSAIAGDAIGFEAWPPKLPRRIHDNISLWGMPIGELWDLEALSGECEAQKRWSFFFTSAPLNLKGGVSSTPNALAVF
ncbi:putative cyclase-domain-containing protein [Clohesyomyces aquaticus]|uniref:Putative cyclase-domain-containing protein n=1 Tax=Clohesyomyces aquaticus TaxID=1231657 RepID=A0A1Y1Z0Z2_9PLEO|nr:putative cyclase-domain-containing protein [Clohesyomyces aquaticus]